MSTIATKSEENPIIFYCKDCEEVVETSRVMGKYVYKCKKCGTKNVAFGSEKSIRSFFKIDEREMKKKREEERAKRAGGQKAKVKEVEEVIDEVVIEEEVEVEKG